MRRTILDIELRDVEKRKIPSKHYVYVIYVTWSDSSTNVIYRRYSRFFDFQSEIMDMFPEEAGSIDPEKRIIPFLPGKKFFGRSHIREVAVKRLGPIADYCKQLLKLPKKLSECKEVLEFFEMEPEDINPPKGKKASVKAKKISNPKPLEEFIAVTDYKKQEKGEISLQVGALVEVVEKTETGWWFVNVEEEQGWVPSTCLEREDGTKEDSTVVFKPGEEEQYLCTEEFKSQSADEISLERGAVVDVLEKNLEGWWHVRYNGKEGYAPATYLMKCDSVKIKKKAVVKQKAPIQETVSTGPQIVRSLHEVSNLLNEENGDSTSSTKANHTIHEFEDNYEIPHDDKIYSINELSKILKEDIQGNEETEKVYESIHAMKSRSLKRRGSTRPPPRPSMKPQIKDKWALRGKAVLARLESQNKEYITICDFSNTVGDGISFKAGQFVKVLEKNEGGWWYIELDDKEGWAPASYIKVSNKDHPIPKPNTPEFQKPGSPVQTSSVQKLPLSKFREELSDFSVEQHSGSKHQSAADIGEISSAFKSQLEPKSKGPLMPHKKDFFGEKNTVGNGSESNTKSDHKSNVPSKQGVNTKPVHRKVPSAPPPLFVKNESDLKERLTCEGSSTKVSDIASVLKAKFETRSSNFNNQNIEKSPPSKPKTIVKGTGSPDRPNTPPGSRIKPSRPTPTTESSPLTTDKRVDSNKYSSRPLPPKPDWKSNKQNMRPRLTVPEKPKPAWKSKTTDAKSDTDGDEVRLVGVSELSKVLTKAKIGGKMYEHDPVSLVFNQTSVNPTNTKSTNDIPISTFKNIENVITERENNNTAFEKGDITYRAVANHMASSEGEISISIGQEVELIEKADGWWYVCTDSAEGWAPSAYLEKIRSKRAGVELTASLKTQKPKTSVFRTCSDFEAEHDGELSVARGQKVQVVDKDDGGWWLVNVNGKEGWVPAAYLEEVM